LRDTELSYGRDRNELCNEVECLRAEKAELIEALGQIEQFSDIGDDLLAVVRMKRIASQALAKIETK
jgi:hypothetical protein